MPRIDSARSNRKRKKKHASRGATPRSSGARKIDASPAEEEEAGAPAAPPVGRLERTRRLILAALRVWELKRKIHD